MPTGDPARPACRDASWRVPQSRPVRPALPHAPAAPTRQRGLLLLGFLLVLAGMGAALAATGTIWHTERQRALETELLFVGLQYRKAIQRYYESPPAGRYPPSIDALLLDNRAPAIRRHLRKPWRDPLTGSPEWGVVPAPGGGIMGVFSLAPGRPIKQSGFPALLGWADAPASYADWKFSFVPGQTPATAVPAPPPVPGAP